MKCQKLVLGLLFIFVLASFSTAVFAKDLVNMEFKQAPLVDVFQILGQLGGYNVLVDPSVTGEITFSLKDLPIEEALDLVTRTTGYRYQLLGKTLVIGSDQRLKTEFGSQDFTFVMIQYVDVEAAQRLVSMMVPNIKSYVDKEQKLLVLFGLKTDLDLAKQVIKQYDQKAFAPLQEGAPAETKGNAETVKVDDSVSYSLPVFYADGGEVMNLVRQQWPTVEVRWDLESKSLLIKAKENDWPAIKTFVQEQDLPQFVLKGLLGGVKEQLALVEYKGSTSLVKQGESLLGWLVLKISNDGVEFSQGERNFVVKIGR